MHGRKIVVTRAVEVVVAAEKNEAVIVGSFVFQRRNNILPLHTYKIHSYMPTVRRLCSGFWLSELRHNKDIRRREQGVCRLSHTYGLRRWNTVGIMSSSDTSYNRGPVSNPWRNPSHILGKNAILM
jgi:hypothetical protein